LLPEHQSQYHQFIREYETVRLAEGRASTEPAYYRSLPFVDLQGNFRKDWKIRARTYQALFEHVLKPVEQQCAHSVKILDLGAGNGWLSNRLAIRGHQVAAVDLITNPYDGLGTRGFYRSGFLSVQADFNRLPFLNEQADLAIFNASFHYASSYESILQETMRVLHPTGQVVILDTPIYHDPRSGIQMVSERQTRFTQLYDFPSTAIASENYLTFARIEQLAEKYHLTWRFIQPNYGWQWRIKPWLHRLRRLREPASFLILSGRRKSV